MPVFSGFQIHRGLPDKRFEQPATRELVLSCCTRNEKCRAVFMDLAVDIQNTEMAVWGQAGTLYEWGSLMPIVVRGLFASQAVGAKL